MSLDQQDWQGFWRAAWPEALESVASSMAKAGIV